MFRCCVAQHRSIAAGTSTDAYTGELTTLITDAAEFTDDALVDDGDDLTWKLTGFQWQTTKGTGDDKGAPHTSTADFAGIT